MNTWALSIWRAIQRMTQLEVPKLFSTSPGFTMKNKTPIAIKLIVAAASLTAALGVQAQSSMSNSYSSMRAPGSGYIGLSVGQSDYSLDDGINVFESNQGDTSYGIHVGNYFSPNFGIELGYTDYGSVARAGGRTKSDGINLSLIGKMPLNPAFNLLGKLGTTYSRTEVSSNPASGIAAGSENGWGLSYGLGVEYVFTPQWSTVLQYESQDMKFAGGRDDRVGVTSLAVRFNY
jgi:opacity protein-like surface antigen